MLFAYGLSFLFRFKTNTYFCRETSRNVENTRFFVSFLTRTNAIWLRLYSDIWSKKWWLEPLVLSSCEAVLSPQSSVLSPRSSVLRSSGCNKLYKCGRQKISKKCTFVAERLKTAVLLQNLDLRHFCRECREKHNIRVSRTKFWENLLMRTSRKLWQPDVNYVYPDVNNLLSIHVLNVNWCKWSSLHPYFQWNSIDI